MHTINQKNIDSVIEGRSPNQAQKAYSYPHFYNSAKIYSISNTWKPCEKYYCVYHVFYTYIPKSIFEQVWTTSTTKAVVIYNKVKVQENLSQWIYLQYKNANVNYNTGILIFNLN